MEVKLNSFLIAILFAKALNYLPIFVNSNLQNEKSSY